MKYAKDFFDFVVKLVEDHPRITAAYVLVVLVTDCIRFIWNLFT